MSGDRKYFRDLMADFAKISGIECVQSEDGDDWTVSLESVLVKLNVSYRETTGLVITSAVVAPFEPSIDPEGRARALLEMNWQWKESRGFTVAVDDEASVLIVVDRRSARRFANPGELGAYFTQAGEVVSELRNNLAEFESLSRRLVEDEIDGTAVGEMAEEGED